MNESSWCKRLSKSSVTLRMNPNINFVCWCLLWFGGLVVWFLFSCSFFFFFSWLYNYNKITILQPCFSNADVGWYSRDQHKMQQYFIWNENVKWSKGSLCHTVCFVSQVKYVLFSLISLWNCILRKENIYLNPKS